MQCSVAVVRLLSSAVVGGGGFPVVLCPCGSGRSVAVVWMCFVSTQTDNLRYRRKYRRFRAVGGITYRLHLISRLFCVCVSLYGLLRGDDTLYHRSWMTYRAQNIWLLR